MIRESLNLGFKKIRVYSRLLWRSSGDYAVFSGGNIKIKGGER